MEPGWRHFEKDNITKGPKYVPKFWVCRVSFLRIVVVVVGRYSFLGAWTIGLVRRAPAFRFYVRFLVCTWMLRRRLRGAT